MFTTTHVIVNTLLQQWWLNNIVTTLLTTQHCWQRSCLVTGRNHAVRFYVCIKLRSHDQFSHFSLTSSLVAWSPAQTTKFSLTRSPVQKLHGMTSFWPRLVVKEKPVDLCRTHEQIKLVKQNLVACAGLYLLVCTMNKFPPARFPWQVLFARVYGWTSFLWRRCSRVRHSLSSFPCRP